MKRLHYFIVYAFFALSGFMACKTRDIRIDVLYPAPVTLPSAMASAGVVKRCEPLENDKPQIVIHQIATAETAAILKEGSDESLRGLHDALLETKRFDKVVLLDSMHLKSPGPGQFPTALSWSEVERICKANRIEALFSLEMFESRLEVDPIIIDRVSGNPNDIARVANARVTMHTRITTGWRIYDPKRKELADEFILYTTITASLSAMNPVLSAEALLNRKEAIKQSANALGRDYAKRIMPYYLTVGRSYYVKGSARMETAARKARSGNWNGAGEEWEKETHAASPKLAGRACYNMALSEEIKGNIDQSISWAKKAYEEYNNKKALNYLSILKDRKRRMEEQKYKEGR